MKLKGVIFLSAFLVALALGGWAWFRFIAHPKPVVCAYSGRPLQPGLMVTAEIAGKRTQVCCVRCAITEANQLQKPLRLIEVHDYSTGRAVSPEKAWYIEGSQAMACNREAMHMDEMKTTQDMAFDRCTPGTFAFANRDAADAFVERNGGAVLSFEQIMREVRFQ